MQLKSPWFFVVENDFSDLHELLTNLRVVSKELLSWFNITNGFQHLELSQELRDCFKSLDIWHKWIPLFWRVLFWTWRIPNPYLQHSKFSRFVSYHVQPPVKQREWPTCHLCELNPTFGPPRCRTAILWWPGRRTLGSSHLWCPPSAQRNLVGVRQKPSRSWRRRGPLCQLCTLHRGLRGSRTWSSKYRWQRSIALRRGYQ